MRTLRSATSPARTVAKLSHPDESVRDALRILAETIVHLNERVELLEARELLNRHA
jgi:hypothetical protein